MAASPRQSKPLLDDNHSMGFGAIDNVQDADITVLTNDNNSSIQNNNVMTNNNGRNNNIDDTLNPKYSHPTYEAIINETIYISYGWIFMASLFCFFDSCSWYVWILYARSLGEHNHHTTAVTIYACYFIQGFATLFWARISDKFTYTRVAQLLCLLLTVAYFIQATADHFERLLMGTILQAISRGLFATSTAFIAKYLPLEYGIKYTSYLYSITTILYLSGPIAGGLIAYYLTYRWCFFVSCGVSGFTFLFMLCVMNGRENKIKNKQIAFSIENPTMKFPVCINKNKERKKSTNGNSINDDQQSLWNSISPSNWFLLFCIVFANASLYAIEAILSTFYTVFATDLYPDNEHIIIIATCQVALYCLCFIVGVRIVPKILKCSWKKKDNFNFENKILIFTQIIMIVSFGYFWSIGNLTIYWILSAGGGLIMGIVNMVQESILLTLQPNLYAGTVAGMKQFGRYTMKAFGCLVVGLLWNVNIYYWAWVQSGLYVISFSCTLLMIFASVCIKIMGNNNDDKIRKRMSVNDTEYQTKE